AGTGDGAAGRYLMTATVTDYALRDDPGRYLTDRVATTTHLEVLDDGTTPLADMWATVLAGTATTRLRGHTVSRYDGDPCTGLPPGQLGDRGLLPGGEKLVPNAESLAEVFTAPDTGQIELPPYLAPAGPAWPPEYPAQYRAGLPPGAGYT